MMGESWSLWSKAESRIRLIMLTPRPFWITYDIIIGSIAGLSSEVFILGSLLIGIYRFDIMRKGAPKTIK
jgi:hypothetical protein